MCPSWWETTEGCRASPPPPPFALGEPLPTPGVETELAQASAPVSPPSSKSWALFTALTFQNILDLQCAGPAALIGS